MKEFSKDANYVSDDLPWKSVGLLSIEFIRRKKQISTWKKAAALAIGRDIMGL